MPADFLEQIAVYKRHLLDEKKAFYENLRKNVQKATLNRYHIFKNALSGPGMHLIAEIKKASPSKGIIREEFDIEQLAKTYVSNKAAAISVLTEDKYFLGRPAHLKFVSDNFPLPTLMKDFIIDEYQIYEAFHSGASAILLIVAMLRPEQLKSMMATAHQLGMDCLVEVHDQWELDGALKADAEIIGVNNRDLKTLEVNIKTCFDLIPKVPKGKVIVAESGLKSHDEIKELQARGANAVLIGETFLTSTDVGAKVKEVMGC